MAGQAIHGVPPPHHDDGNNTDCTGMRMFIQPPALANENTFVCLVRIDRTHTSNSGNKVWYLKNLLETYAAGYIWDPEHQVGSFAGDSLETVFNKVRAVNCIVTAVLFYHPLAQPGENPDPQPPLMDVLIAFVETFMQLPGAATGPVWLTSVLQAQIVVLAAAAGVTVQQYIQQELEAVVAAATLPN